jgi:hypothetical protein
MLAFGWPWLVLWVAIKTWTWALASRGSDDAIPALVITIVVFAEPFYESPWRGKAWQAIGVILGVAAFSVTVITWLAPHLAAEGIHATLHTRADDEDYAKAEVPYLLVVYFYSEMAMLGVVAIGSMIIALSRLRPTIETLRSIGQRLIEYWCHCCCQPHQRQLNRTLALSLTQFLCATFLAYGAFTVAIWYDSAFNTIHPSGAELLAEGALYANNALALPPNKLICSNFGRYDLIHRVGPGRVDVIPRRMARIGPSQWETQRQTPLLDVPCVSALAR